jgi:sigma-B regulation protein RsbU (phosphoserine phosphatase)
VVVADVSGHGAPAAIVMAMIRAVLHTCDAILHDPVAVLEHLNRHFEFLWDTAMFATAVYGVLDVERGTWRSIRAGHPPPLLVRPGRPSVEVRSGESRMLLFGELGGLVAEEQPLLPGDRLVCYTDGLTDRQGPDGQLYDVERLSMTLERGSDAAPAVMLERLVADVEAFTGGREAEDDQTVLAIGLR